MKTLSDVLLFGAVFLGIPILISFVGALLGGAGMLTREAHEEGEADALEDLMESKYNPATGLKMVGGVDADGNPYGTWSTESRHDDD